MAQGIEIEILHVEGRRFEYYLVLVIMLQPVWIVAVAAVSGASRGLYVGDVPRLGAESPQEGRRIEGAGADLEIITLYDDAALSGPVFVQSGDYILEIHA